MRIRLAATIIAAALLSACAGAPTSIVNGPTSARPLPPPYPPVAQNNGAIYQASTYRPAFEDRRARHVGDVINVVITESTSAVKNGASAGSKSGSVNFGVPGVLQNRLGANVATSADNKFADADSQSLSNSFRGTIGATVVEVLSNGNLVIAGEKQVGMNKATEYIRISGMVNPDSINGNSVASTAIADARVEYRTKSNIDGAEVQSMLSRFFLSLLPF
ncbi:flagellar basal body L-ring protein FlgH [Duganella sp. Root1480D1]|uniref:flagellar basal body L-ring protein FlgH n=1 Tax=Duganella sp. Root1480D1 TaxID=1736471 RepID=UPI000709D798|nr:flagellar basal body L-ring protein FlgH [Duganella sp. Root1480D1]KQZ43355.1 flagellar biosynthesis protein FlgH [Duganella sp. Root1480D1]